MFIAEMCVLVAALVATPEDAKINGLADKTVTQRLNRIAEAI